MVKPVNSKTITTEMPTTKSKTDNKVKIGGVIFDKDQIDTNKTKTYTENGTKMNTVFVKPGVQIDFPDQDPNKNASVESLGLRSEWYNPDDSYININNLDNAKIYGNSNKSDYINLNGDSNGNEIFVDQKESWYVDGNQRHDRVQLGQETSNNTVHMDEKDKLNIFYNQTGIEMGGKVLQDTLGHLKVEGKGTSEQEVQLKNKIKDYQHHKFLQKHE